MKVDHHRLAYHGSGDGGHLTELARAEAELLSSHDTHQVIADRLGISPNLVASYCNHLVHQSRLARCPHVQRADGESEQPPSWNWFGQQDPGQDQEQPQSLPDPPDLPDQQDDQMDPGQYQDWSPYPPPQPPFSGQQPSYIPPPGRRPADPWPVRHKVLTGILAAAALLFAAGIGAVAGSKSAGSAAPAPTVTVTSTAATVAKPHPTVTVTKTVQATTNKQGEATQISADGVYVVGQDIPGGTWHTAGGQQCYEATLSGDDTTNDIISNINFSGPDTVSLDGVKAFDINGDCTWQQEG
jgi:DNA-binding CsgD family transcriptional regulator